MRDHNVFHVSLLKKYVHDPNHMINWNVIQVESKGEFQVELACILYRKYTTLQNHMIEQVKVQWKHLGFDEATWEIEEAMWETCPFLFKKDNTKDGAIIRGRRMQYP